METARKYALAEQETEIPKDFLGTFLLKKKLIHEVYL